MKTIKFRVWDRKNRNFLPEHLFAVCDNENLIIFSGHDVEEVSCGPKHQYEISQYTGFRDKRGVEIYEGDILMTKGLNQSHYDSSNPNRRVVRRYDKDNRLHLFGKGVDYPASGVGLSKTTRGRFEVIGHIYNAPQ